MDIQIFNNEFVAIGVLDSFNSFSFTQKYNKKSSFILKAQLTPTTKKLLKVDNIIYFEGKAGFIESVQYSINESETIVATGVSLNYYLNRRIIWNTIDFSGTVEDFILKAVDENAITTTTERKLAGLSLGSKKGLVPTLKKQVSYKNLFTVVSEVALAADLGFKIDFIPKEKKLVFEVYEGAETGLVFSRSLDNIRSLDYVDSKKDYATIMKVGGKGEGAARLFSVVGDGIGFNRYEGFVDATELDTEEQLAQKGKEQLASSYRINTLDGTTVTNNDSFIIGGKVKVIDKELGLILSTRITEIEEIYEGKGKTTNLVFGYNVPSIYEKIKG